MSMRLLLSINCLIFCIPDALQALSGDTARFLLNIGGTVLLYSGQGITEELISEEDAAIYKQLLQEREEMRLAFIKFQQELNGQIQTMILTQSQQFRDALESLSKQRSKTEENLVNRIKMLQQLAQSDEPKEHYLLYPIAFDQQFAASRMPLDPPWYNLYQSMAGDWSYDVQRSSFIQRMLVPWTTPHQAIQNYIFTEYFPIESSSPIEVDITLINAAYPFFAGVLFNKSRWVSGSPERMYLYRLLGIYGTKTGQEVSLQLCFAEGITITEKTITTPLEKIIKQEPGSLIATLSSDVMKQLIKGPITFTLKILPNVSTIDIELFLKTETQMQSLVKKTVISPQKIGNNRASSYGLGFMAPGCQALFTCKKPTALSTAIITPKCG